MGKHNDPKESKFKVEYVCDDDKHEHKDKDKDKDKDKHKHPHKPKDKHEHEHKHKHECKCEHEHKHKPDKEHGHGKPVSSSCGVEHVRVFGSSTEATVFPKTIKVPVTLAEISVVVCVEADIQLEKPALEIIRTWKSVILEQCELVPTFNPYVAKLFGSGFIRKNIEYATADHVSGSAVCGDIRHISALVPFDFCADITFPASGPSLQLTPDFSSSGELANKAGTGAQLNMGLFGNRQVYNEKPHCELVYSEFTELDIGQEKGKGHCAEHSFSHVREKIVLKLGLKVLQDQQVPLPGTTPPPKPPYSCK
ncbi:CsxC family protein [Brevibacillus sp. SAFN-007a]|uniref:CsxC family protein n=1 Tax=Brevibacillus sp. SAFN-007a TaxID=3436862 RepID=UPI003F80E7F0